MIKKKKKKELILVFLILIPAVLAVDLSQYPSLFIDNRSIDSILVIGENAKEDESAALNIINGLKLSEYYMQVEKIPRVLSFKYETPLKKDNEITNIYEKNIIIAGGPCANKVAARIMNIPSTWPECAESFKKDFAKIKLYNNYGKYQLLIAGYEAKDTGAASSVFINFTKYNLRGKNIEVNAYNPNNIVLRNIE